MDGWVGGWVEVIAILRTAYSNQKIKSLSFLTSHLYLFPLKYCYSSAATSIAIRGTFIKMSQKFGYF